MSHALQPLATKLRKAVSTVTAYCRKGLIPGAYKTKGGHWRVNRRNMKASTMREALKAIRSGAR